MCWKIAVLAALTVVWLFEMLLHGLNARSVRNPIPENVKDVYDAETYAKWRQYHGEKNRLSLLSSTASWIISMLLMALNAYAAFAGLFPKDSLWLQMFAVLALPLIYIPTWSNIRINKWVFYLFYPGHLIGIMLVRFAMELGK